MTGFISTFRGVRLGAVALAVALGVTVAAPASAQDRTLTIRKYDHNAYRYQPLDVNATAPAPIGRGQQKSWARDSMAGNPAWDYNDFLRGPMPDRFNGPSRPLLVF